MYKGTDIKKAINEDILISTQMSEALLLWSRMYNNDAPWLSRDVKSLNLPSMIAAELAKSVTIEMKGTVSGSARANYLNLQLAPVLSDLRRYVEYGLAKGGLILKPYIDGGNIAVDYILADRFFPTAFDSSGHILGAVFAEQIKRNGKVYTRLEHHSMAEEGCYITNLAFVSNSESELGAQIGLERVDEWKGLEPQVLIRGIKKPLFAYFKTPFANTVDALSPLGVSAYSRAVELIMEADKQYSRLLWEFESGERALFVSDTAFKRDADGRPMLPNRRLYKTIDGAEDLFEDWTPTFREQSILNGLDSILMKIEDACGLARGTFSNPQTEAKTATELKILRQRSFATVADTQKSLQCALEDLLCAMDVWATLGKLAPVGKFEAAFEFDDSIVADRQAEFAEKQQLVESGIMQKWEFRMWYFGESEEAAKAKVGDVEIEK